mmetsp:Transcript_15022/g.23925  ORF Transcript_15022/g.23925 Transcript_15022/m.23925 type:complete len:81 (-) Transcript_15022:923-1165(-)
MASGARADGVGAATNGEAEISITDAAAAGLDLEGAGTVSEGTDAVVHSEVESQTVETTHELQAGVHPSSELSSELTESEV